MYRVRPMEQLHPMEWQFLSLLSRVTLYLPWRAGREILRVSCGSPEPTDAEMNLDYRTLASEGRIHAYGGGALSTYICDNDIRTARGLAAAAFGPIDFEGAFRLALLRADA